MNWRYDLIWLHYVTMSSTIIKMIQLFSLVTRNYRHYAFLFQWHEEKCTIREYTFPQSKSPFRGQQEEENVPDSDPSGSINTIYINFILMIFQVWSITFSEYGPEQTAAHSPLPNAIENSNTGECQCLNAIEELRKIKVRFRRGISTKRIIDQS